MLFGAEHEAGRLTVCLCQQHTHSPSMCVHVYVASEMMVQRLYQVSQPVLWM